MVASCMATCGWDSWYVSLVLNTSPSPHIAEPDNRETGNCITSTSLIL